MFSLMSLLKSLALTLFIVLLLQVRIGPNTIENQAISWFRTSALMSPIQVVAEGGVRWVRNTSSQIAGLFRFNISEKIKNRPGQRDLQLKFERSQQYLKEKAKRVSDSWQSKSTQQEE